MFRFLAWVHGLLFRLCWWALRLPFRALWATVLAIVALLGEEVRRWLGLGVMGLMIFLLGKATLNYAPEAIKLPLALVTLALVAFWALAAMRAARFTLTTNLRAVRQRRYFRELKGEVGKLGDRWDGAVENLADRTQGTRAGPLFAKNRAANEAAARQAERERREAEAAYLAAEAEERRRRDEMAAGFDPYETLTG